MAERLRKWIESEFTPGYARLTMEHPRPLAWHQASRAPGLAPLQCQRRSANTAAEHRNIRLEVPRHQ